ncbi:MAG: hypothetical protein N2482_01040 [Patescibacteria group bacterium]|nr:hypothetical protein [Patescibacteria group bacterium]
MNKGKNLEKKILDRVYRFETKKTVGEILLKGATFLFLGFTVFILGSIFYEILKEQTTFDLLEIFSEDFEVIKKYFFETVYIFYLELPKIILILLLILISIFFYLSWQLFKNFNKIKNKVISLIKFWRRKI